MKYKSCTASKSKIDQSKQAKSIIIWTIFYRFYNVKIRAHNLNFKDKVWCIGKFEILRSFHSITLQFLDWVFISAVYKFRFFDIYLCSSCKIIFS